MLKKLCNVSFKAFVIILITVVLLSILAMLGMFSVDHATKIHGASQYISTHFLFFSIWRYSLMLIIIYFYPKIMQKLFSGKDNIDPQKLVKFSQRRWIILIFSIYELLIVHNLLSVVVNYLLGL